MKGLDRGLGKAGKRVSIEIDEDKESWHGMAISGGEELFNCRIPGDH
jgi:hypothetical protein